MGITVQAKLVRAEVRTKPAGTLGLVVQVMLCEADDLLSLPLPTRKNSLDHSRRWAVPTYSPTQYFVLENSRNSEIPGSRKSMRKKRSVVVGFSVAVTEH